MLSHPTNFRHSLIFLSIWEIPVLKWVFFWTPPHFWALALYRAGDYAKAGVPMLPVVAGRAETRRQILIYSLLLVPMTLVPWLTGLASLVYGIGAGALGGLFIFSALKVYRAEADDRPAKQMFGYSILYLFLLFTLLSVERAMGWSG